MTSTQSIHTPPIGAARVRRDGAGRGMRRLAWLCVALLLAVVMASAWLRLMQPRMPCTDWPACRSAAHVAMVRSAPTAASSGAPSAAPAAARAEANVRAEPLVRGTHRLAASAALVLIVALVVLSARMRRPAALAGRWPEVGGRLPLALLVLALALSVLGIVTPGSRSIFVLLGNQLGGLVMLAMAFALARRLAATPPPPMGWRTRLAAIACALGWLAQAALGAAAGAAPAAGTPVPLMHVALAIVVAPAALLIAMSARAAGRRHEGRGLVAVVIAQAVLGPLAAGAAAAPLLVWLHNLAAAIGVAVLAALAFAPRPEAAAGPAAPGGGA
ncbi:MAG: hypothetical protein JNJ89_14395 [Rubrivivax sp.]|nr:hypothetical protein [Rubrivivax sp.]